MRSLHFLIYPKLCFYVDKGVQNLYYFSIHCIDRIILISSIALMFIIDIGVLMKSFYYNREIQEVISVDPCHKFTWCLDACIREKNVDLKRSRELQVI